MSKKQAQNILVLVFLFLFSPFPPSIFPPLRGFLFFSFFSFFLNFKSFLLNAMYKTLSSSLLQDSTLHPTLPFILSSLQGNLFRSDKSHSYN